MENNHASHIQISNNCRYFLEGKFYDITHEELYEKWEAFQNAQTPQQDTIKLITKEVSDTINLAQCYNTRRTSKVYITADIKNTAYIMLVNVNYITNIIFASSKKLAHDEYDKLINHIVLSNNTSENFTQYETITGIERPTEVLMNGKYTIRLKIEDDHILLYVPKKEITENNAPEFMPVLLEGAEFKMISFSDTAINEEEFFTSENIATIKDVERYNPNDKILYITREVTNEIKTTYPEIDLRTLNPTEQEEFGLKLMRI